VRKRFLLSELVSLRLGRQTTTIVMLFFTALTMGFAQTLLAKKRQSTPEKVI